MTQNNNSFSSWHDLTPNYPNGRDILPGRFDLYSLSDLGSVAVGMTLDAPREAPVSQETAFGTLTRIGQGETSVAYRLTENDKSIIIKVGGRGDGPADTFPSTVEDHHLTVLQRSPTLTKLAYADPRTYLTWSRYGRVLSLQEDDGSPLTGSVTSLLVPYTKRQALTYIKRNLSPDPKDLQNHGTMGELAHPRHYLQKPGIKRPLVIDIPVIKRHQASYQGRQTAVH